MSIPFVDVTDGTVATAASMNSNFALINDKLDAAGGDGLEAAEMKAKWYRSQMVFTVAAPANDAVFDFGKIMVPPIAQYAVVEGLSVGVEAIASGSVKCSVLVNGSIVGGSVTVTAAAGVTLVFDSLAATTIAASQSIKIQQTSNAYTGVTNLTVCLFLKQIDKEA